MIELDHSLVIEATDEPDFFGFYSPDLEGFTGIGHSIEDCLYFGSFSKRALPGGPQEPSTPSPPARTIASPHAGLGHAITSAPRNLLFKKEAKQVGNERAYCAAKGERTSRSSGKPKPQDHHSKSARISGRLKPGLALPRHKAELLNLLSEGVRG